MVKNWRKKPIIKTSENWNEGVVCILNSDIEILICYWFPNHLPMICLS